MFILSVTRFRRLDSLLNISVIIPAFNAQSTIGKCLDSVAVQNPAPLEIIVVDDCSNDTTAEIAAERRTRVIRCDRRSGPAVARNRGAESARGNILLFLDADVTIPPDLSRKILDILKEEDSMAAVQTLYSPRCAAEDLVSEYQNFYYYHALAHVKWQNAAIFATWCAAVRRNDFFAVGGFNTRIPEPTVEDEEFGYSLADSGRFIRLARDIQVVHHASYTLSQFVSRRLRMARAQAKSGWRSIRDRLLRRYVNIRETGTHHSRWVVLSILLVMAAQALLLAAAGSALLGSSAWRWLLPAALAGLVLSQLCHLSFFGRAVSHFGAGVLPGFVLMCVLDMAVLGWGILQGTLQFILGRKY
ncbi:MAG: glycosyltransferase family 2 protein [Candidatus Aegiribacteria sp.]